MEQRTCRSHSVITAACCTWIRTRWTAVARNLGCGKGGRRGVARIWRCAPFLLSYKQLTIVGPFRALYLGVDGHAARAGQFIPFQRARRRENESVVKLSRLLAFRVCGDADSEPRGHAHPSPRAGSRNGIGKGYRRE